MPALTLIDTVARREDKFPLGCEIVLEIARKSGWRADKTITDKGNAEKIGALEKDYDIIGFSLYHQLQYFNIVPIFKSFGIPLLTYDRKKGDPILCAGGAAVTSNPFPVASFFDFILLGDAEEVFPQILRLYDKNKDRFLRTIADTFESVLVPKYPRTEGYKVAIAKDISESILPPLEGRQPKIELARGCRFNCSFCLQSIIPYRENPLSAIVPILYQYAPKSVFLSANTPASYSEFLPLLDYCKQEKIYPRGLSERLSSLKPDVLEKMRDLNMIQANIGIEGYSERLRQMIGKPISKDSLISKLCLIQRYVPILSVNFISHLPTVDILDVLEFKETMEAVLSQRDLEEVPILGIPQSGTLKTGYDFTTTPLIARPHTKMELCPYREEKAEDLAKEARISLLDQFTGVKMKFSMSAARRKMEFLLSRGDESFRDLFIKTYSKYPTYYFHQTFAEKILNCFADGLDVDYWLSSEVHPHWHRLSF
jgi:radical SAM superfamily enzyme YgiQ (UPF0313 family)